MLLRAWAAFALLAMLAGSCSGYTLLTPCDDGMGGDNGGSLKKTKPTTKSSAWAVPLIDKAVRNQKTLDAIFSWPRGTTRTGCKLTSYTWTTKFCVPKVRE